MIRSKTMLWAVELATIIELHKIHIRLPYIKMVE